jgi:hypothetical protein
MILLRIDSQIISRLQKIYVSRASPALTGLDALAHFQWRCGGDARRLSKGIIAPRQGSLFPDAGIDQIPEGLLQRRIAQVEPAELLFQPTRRQCGCWRTCRQFKGRRTEKNAKVPFRGRLSDPLQSHESSVNEYTVIWSLSSTPTLHSFKTDLTQQAQKKKKWEQFLGRSDVKRDVQI